MKISGDLEIINHNAILSSLAFLPRGEDSARSQTTSEHTDEIRQGNQPTVTGIKGPVSKKLVRHEVDYINKQLESMNYSIRFSIDDKLKELVVKIVNTRTDKVIKQIPPADMLKFREKMKEMVGLLVEEKT